MHTSPYVFRFIPLFIFHVQANSKTNKAIMVNPSALHFFFLVIKESITKFLEDDLMTQAAALAYYTIFSLPPMILVILYTATRFYDEITVKAAIFGEIENLIGASSAEQLAITIDKLGVYETTSWATFIGIGTLLFTSTTVFVTMQNALNHTFKVKAKPKGMGILKMLKDRVLSFSILMGIAFVLLVSLTINALVSTFSHYLADKIGGLSTTLTALTSIFLPLIIITGLFAMIFKYLPDAKLKWKDTWTGAIFTALCFSIGKYLIGFYIGNSQTANLYDAAGSVMVIMVWVFFASSIFLFGAVFTFVYTKFMSGGIPPAPYAVKVIQKEIEVSKPEIKN